MELSLLRALNVVVAPSVSQGSLGVGTIEVDQAVTENLTVTGLGAGFPAPTGNVTFRVMYDSGSWMNYSVNVSLENGHAMSTWYTPAAAGSYVFEAVYSGDSNYGNSWAFSYLTVRE